MTDLKKDHNIQTALLGLISALLLLSITLIGREFAKLGDKLTEMDSFTQSVHIYEIIPNTERLKELSGAVKKISAEVSDNNGRIKALEAADAL